jgi:hypothetical protein
VNLKTEDTIVLFPALHTKEKWNVQTHDIIMEKCRDPFKRHHFVWGEPMAKGLWDDFLRIHNPTENVICVAAHPNLSVGKYIPEEVCDAEDADYNVIYTNVHVSNPLEGCNALVHSTGSSPRRMSSPGRKSRPRNLDHIGTLLLQHCHVRKVIEDIETKCLFSVSTCCKFTNVCHTCNNTDQMFVVLDYTGSQSQGNNKEQYCIVDTDDCSFG